MIVAEPMTAPRWARRVVTCTAVVGAVIAASGFLWVTVVAGLFPNPLDTPRWSGVSVVPGMTAFIIGSLMLLGALITIRVHLHPQLDGRLLWASVWLGWAAIAFVCFGVGQSTGAVAHLGASDLEVGLFGAFIFLGALTFATFVIGCICLLLRLMDRDDHR
jgi:hypothetical protein